jgi:uncharacterized protein YdeI (YjbR/CyaY-like superfamily)
MSEESPKYFKSIDEWRKWLSQNHNDEEVIWIIIQKKGSKKQGLRYEEAVVEAVAHGWIDGKMKRLNEYEFMQRFTPRRRNSIWSASNKKRAELLIKEGKMTELGMKAVEDAKQSGKWDKAYSSRRGKIEIPDDLLSELKLNKLAYENFKAFPPSARFMYIHWLNEAKRNDTRIRRINTIVYRSEKNQKPGIDLRIVKKITSL